MRSTTAPVRAGLWVAGVVTALGIVYGAGIIWLVCSTGSLSPGSFSPRAQTVAGLATLVVVQLVLILVVCVDQSLPARRRFFSQLSIAFTACFAVAVSINRFVQLAVVRPAQLIGTTDQLSRFMPYERGSAMFALEILGWGVFLSLALVVLAPAFRGNRLESGIRGACIVYGVLSMIGAAGYALHARWFGLGFVAWGLVLYAWTAMLVVWFRRTATRLNRRAPSFPESAARSATSGS